MLLRTAVVVRRVVVALVLSVFVGVTALAQTTPAWAVDSWSTPVDLSDDTQDARGPQIVAAPNNTLTAIWYRSNGTKQVIQTSTSSDAGATWSAAVDLSDDTQNAYEPHIVAAPNNTLTAIWHRDNGTKDWVVQTRTSSDAGATWSAVVDLSDGTQSATLPRIVAAPNNTLTAIWERSNGTTAVIQTRTSNDAGATWSAVVDLSDDTQNAYEPQIVAAPNNTLTAIWHRDNGTKDWVVQTRTSSDAGATWSAVVDLSDGTQSATLPRIVAAPNNTLTAIWERSNGTKNVVQTRTSSDAGATWSAVVDLSDGTQSATLPRIVAAPNNTLTAIWYRFNGTTDVIQTRTSSDAGATWSATVDLSDDTQNAYNPQIVAAPNNTLTAIWDRREGTKDVIQTRTSSDAGATWSATVDLSDGTQSATLPRIVAAPNNTLTAIWYRFNGTTDVIQSSSLASSSSASASADPGVPGIFLAVNDVLVGSQVTGAPIYCGADSIQPNSIYTLSIQSVTNSALTRIILDSGSVNSRGHLDERVLLPEVNPGSYKIVMTGIHASGNLLVLTNFITIGANGGIVSVSPESQQPFLK